MREDDIRVLLHRDPRPLLRLHLAGGMVFELPEFETVFLSHSTVEFPLPDAHDQQREAVISLLQIVWVEVIDPPA
jgi:hypothetical protein